MVTPEGAPAQPDTFQRTEILCRALLLAHETVVTLRRTKKNEEEKKERKIERLYPVAPWTKRSITNVKIVGSNMTIL